MMALVVTLVALLYWALRNSAPTASFSTTGSQDSQPDANTQNDRATARLSSSPTVASAEIIPALVLEDLTRDADLIVVGEARAVWEEERTTLGINGQPIPACRMVAQLRVSRVIKGKLDQPSVSYKFFLPKSGPRYEEVVTGEFGLFFLLMEQQQEYVVLNPYYPFVVASPDVPEVEGSYFDRVVAEVAQVLTSPGTTTNQRRQAIEVLGGVKTEPATRALRRAANESDMTLRLEAIAFWLRRNDTSGLSVAADVLLSSQQNTEDYVLKNLAFALEGIRDPKAIPSLSRLLEADDVQTRRSAAAALRHTDVEDAIKPLSRALEDSDREVRYHAVLGFAEITKQGEWGPSTSKYIEDEQHYLTYWREWVKNRR
jgi:hypothetical protein